jgi:hypothetical protein
MSDKPTEERGGVELPECAAQFIRQVIRRMRYTRRARREVQTELRPILRMSCELVPAPGNERSRRDI